MMFANAEGIDPHLIGEHPFGHYVAQRLCLCNRAAVLVERDITKGIEAEFNHSVYRPYDAWRAQEDSVPPNA